MKKRICGRIAFVLLMSLLLPVTVKAKDINRGWGTEIVAANASLIPQPEGTLYAQSAVLMDGASGRILYEKNGQEFMANASTTKILTCILALEEGNMEEPVKVSAYAASMPDVQLNINEGERYYLEDLLYSLMLESHNDSAVAIAEHVAGSCEEFAAKMNEKAEGIGCKNTYFLTPNGLDATETISKDGEQIEVKEHGTTAADLALIMRYCIEESPKKDDFLQITRTANHTFSNIELIDGNIQNGSRSFTCRNHNAFLQMMDGALSGKTGFTSKAGYCYIGSLRRENRTFIVALLACGWPGNRNYKWQDTRMLMEYGLNSYEYFPLEALEPDWGKELKVSLSGAKTDRIGENADVFLQIEEKGNISGLLLNENEELTVTIEKEELSVPVNKGEEAGQVIYAINGKEWIKKRLMVKTSVDKIDFLWCIEKCLNYLCV